MPETAVLLETLRRGLSSLAEDPDTHPCEQYINYLVLLDKWNKSYNLSGIKELPMMLTHHVLDSLSVLPFLKGQRALDVGTGAGLPGLILALARPEMFWVLLDSNQKKVRFVQQALLELGIENVEVVHSRVEDYAPERFFSSITARAFNSATQFCQQCGNLLLAEGRFILMKGPAVEEELAGLAEQGFNGKVEAVQVPELDARRNLLLIERQH